MTELCMYQLEDLVWDDFCKYDNHGVPRLSDAQAKEHSFPSKSLKRTHEVANCVVSDVGNLSYEVPVSREKAEMETFTAYDGQNKMLEKEDWSQKTDGVVPSRNDESVKEVSTLVSGGTRTSNKRFHISEGSGGSELCLNDSSLNDKSAAVVDSFGDPFDRVAGADDDLTFFGNNSEEGGCNDFLDYGWSDIRNFEDVDRMFRSCDSTFALSTRNEDVDWYSSSDAFGGSKFSCPESSALEGVDGIHDDSRLNESNCSNKKDELVAGGQFDEQENQLKHKNQAEGSKNDHLLSANRSFQADGILVSVQQQKRESDCNNYEYLQSDTPHLSSDKGHPSENSSLTFLSPKDSCTSNYVQSNKGISFVGTSNPHQKQGPTASFNNETKNMDSAISGTTSMENLDACLGNEFTNQAKCGVDMEIAGGSGSSIKHERSSMSSWLDDISKEATGFGQFQLVIGRLDSRTKLCIRDSLYRLAWSAEQRYNSLKLNDESSDARDANGGLLTKGTNMYAGFMDIESETNPIDRSMAHLLFHRPGDSSVMPGHDSVSFTTPIEASF